MLRVPLADTTCAECHGRGYAAFDCDDRGHAPVEIQANDGCGCVAVRAASFVGLGRDDAAAVLFVRDLECGDPWALRCAAALGLGTTDAGGAR